MKTKNKFLLLILLSFILNLIWEFAHSSLYTSFLEIPKIQLLITASFVDAIIITGIFSIISMKNRTFNWIKKPKKQDYLLIFYFGVTIAVIIELISVGNWWIYKDAMPTILGIGISPLFQLFTTAILSLWIVKKLKDK